MVSLNSVVPGRSTCSSVTYSAAHRQHKLDLIGENEKKKRHQIEWQRRRSGSGEGGGESDQSTSYGILKELVF